MFVGVLLAVAIVVIFFWIFLEAPGHKWVGLALAVGAGVYFGIKEGEVGHGVLAGFFVLAMAAGLRASSIGR